MNTTGDKVEVIQLDQITLRNIKDILSSLEIPYVYKVWIDSLGEDSSILELMYITVLNLKDSECNPTYIAKILHAEAKQLGLDLTEKDWWTMTEIIQALCIQKQLGVDGLRVFSLRQELNSQTQSRNGVAETSLEAVALKNTLIESAQYAQHQLAIKRFKKVTYQDLFKQKTRTAELGAPEALKEGYGTISKIYADAEIELRKALKENHENTNTEEPFYRTKADTIIGDSLRTLFSITISYIKNAPDTLGSLEKVLEHIMSSVKNDELFNRYGNQKYIQAIFREVMKIVVSGGKIYTWGSAPDNIEDDLIKVDNVFFKVFNIEG